MLPKYEIGTWVYDKNHPHIKMKIASVHWSNARYEPAYRNNKATVIYESDIVLWEPQHKEWCWFSDEEQVYHGILAEFGCLGEFDDLPYETIDGTGYRYCEPFVYDLPSNLVPYSPVKDITFTEETIGDNGNSNASYQGVLTDEEVSSPEDVFKRSQIDFEKLRRMLLSGA